MTLTVRAKGRAAPTEADLAHRGVTTRTRSAFLSVCNEERSITTRSAVNHPIVPEGGAFAIYRCGEDVSDSAMERERAFASYSARRRMYPRQPERFVGIDVADACDG